jgi:hypothetical protein
MLDTIIIRSYSPWNSTSLQGSLVVVIDDYKKLVSNRLGVLKYSRHPLLMSLKYPDIMIAFLFMIIQCLCADSLLISLERLPATGQSLPNEL